MCLNGCMLKNCCNLLPIHNISVGSKLRSTSISAFVNNLLLMFDTCF